MTKSEKDRKVGRVIRKLNASKTPAEARAILEKLQREDPETYKKVRES